LILNGFFKDQLVDYTQRYTFDFTIDITEKYFFPWILLGFNSLKITARNCDLNVVMLFLFLID